MKLGDGLALLALMIWVMVSVGPIWLGFVILIGAWVLNLFEALLHKKLKGDRDGSMDSRSLGGVNRGDQAKHE